MAEELKGGRVAVGMGGLGYGGRENKSVWPTGLEWKKVKLESTFAKRRGAAIRGNGIGVGYRKRLLYE